MAKIIGTTEFDNEVLQNNLPVLVDFYAEWCMPCKMIAPALEEISQEYEDKAAVVKVDIDKSEELVVKYGIRSVPTMVFYKNGEVEATIIGAASKQVIQEKLDALIEADENRNIM